jgi:hypothetical protein
MSATMQPAANQSACFDCFNWLSDQRRAALVEDFVDGSMRTPEVQTLLKLRTPQAVHRLRSRGKMGVGSLRAGSKDRSRPACMLHVNRQRCPP